MGLWREVLLADAPYLKLTQIREFGSEIDVEKAVPEALKSIEDLRDLFIREIKAEPLRLKQIEGALDQVKGLVEPIDELTSVNADVRWVTTVAALRQAQSLSYYVLQLAEFISLPSSVQSEFGIRTDPGPTELVKAIVAYIEHLVFILRGDPSNQDGYAPPLPDSLRRHFLLLWLKGGTWWSHDPSRTLRMDEHDGGPRALAHWSDPVALAQQIERWSVWLAVNTIPTRERPTRYNSIKTILALKHKGYSGPKIASELGITYEAVKMALMRHERRLSKEREEQMKMSKQALA